MNEATDELLAWALLRRIQHVLESLGVSTELSDHLRLTGPAEYAGVTVGVPSPYREHVTITDDSREYIRYIRTDSAVLALVSVAKLPRNPTETEAADDDH